MFVSVPMSRRMPSMRASTSRTSSIWRRRWSGVTWLPKPVGRRVVGVREVLVAAGERGLRHLLDRVAPVGGDRVRVHVALRSPPRSGAGSRRRGRLELAAVLAQLGRDPRQAEALVDLLLGRAAVRLAGRVVEDPVLGDVQALRTAASRSATLCSLEPVKCWSRLPNWSGSTTRKSTAIPVWVRPRAAFSPAVPDDSMTSSSANAWSARPGRTPWR
jgi:hypothetical protein